MTITKESNPELYKELTRNCDFDTDHVPKHGAGYVIAKAEIDGIKYECHTEWDYTNGVEWDYGYQVWNIVEKFSNLCPHCGQKMP